MCMTWPLSPWSREEEEEEEEEAAVANTYFFHKLPSPFPPLLLACRNLVS